MRYQILITLCCALACSAEFADEMQVYENECLGEDRVPCDSSGCIWRNQICDGIKDCADGSDESMCFSSLSPCNMSHPFSCGPDTQQCLSLVRVCNGYKECSNGFDEANCTQDQIDVSVMLQNTCPGFQCGDGLCISPLWVCDGDYDCEDHTDETKDSCRVSNRLRTRFNMPFAYNPLCASPPSHQFPLTYRCLDSSFCLPQRMMCDGILDCKDGSDEGPFCTKWSAMCNNHDCGNSSDPVDGAVCIPDRYGAYCKCISVNRFNYTTMRCESYNACENPVPACAQNCTRVHNAFMCTCAEGYSADWLNIGHVCFAKGPEPYLFFSTANDIRYIKLRTKKVEVIATGMKKAHGVSYDGQHIYWVETAKGHQCIVRAHIDDVEGTREVLVGIGLEDVSDVAVDWLGGHIYFGDVERGAISVCRKDGSLCTTLKTISKFPKYITLDPVDGRMFWADWNNGPVIMRGNMAGEDTSVFTKPRRFITSLALDLPAGRLFYADGTIMGVRIDNGRTYTVFDKKIHHPYVIAVFENSVYWSDKYINIIQDVEKKHGETHMHTKTYTFDASVNDMHIYHPVLMKAKQNPCENTTCSHMCLLTSNVTSLCACPEGMDLINGTQCIKIGGYEPLYLVVGQGNTFIRIQYNSLGHPERHATYFDIGRVQAMAFDNTRDTLYIYDSQRKSINFINMTEFTLGVTYPLLYRGLVNVIDMDYDFLSDSLYVLDVGRRCIEVVSLRTLKRSLLHRFEHETPLSFCLIQHFGTMLVAVSHDNRHGDVHIDSLGLDGSNIQHIMVNDMKGPHVYIRYSHHLDSIYMADEGNRVIEFIHPRGAGRETFRVLATSITGMAVTDTLVFWTDRRTNRLYWADVHQVSSKIRRFEFSLFKNTTYLYLQTAIPLPPDASYNKHPCRQNPNPCTDICVQTPRFPNYADSKDKGYKCLCPTGLIEVDGRCVEVDMCAENQAYCHFSNICIQKNAVCDGKKDCYHGEDEEDCPVPASTNTTRCPPNERFFDDACVPIEITGKNTSENTVTCTEDEFECVQDKLCISRTQLCDQLLDCPDGSDENKAVCNTLNCLHTEFMCTSGSCILASFKCDGEPDCYDGSDEANCGTVVCPKGYFQCRNQQCVELKKRCDGNHDCSDTSDEVDCQEPDIVETKELGENCGDWELPCALDRSICLPRPARCNGKVECPGSTDELNCPDHCTLIGFYECPHDERCLNNTFLCDGKKDCSDGSDEIPATCSRVNRTSVLYPTLTLPRSECRDNYYCKTGECIEWQYVCNNYTDCIDESDEGAMCFTACENTTCSYSCQPTPMGGLCRCPPGYEDKEDSCVDINECIDMPCSHWCHNTPGTFICTCYPGYALRADRQSCKATKGLMEVLYVAANSIRAISTDGFSTIQYKDSRIKDITDMDYDLRRHKIFFSSGNKLVELNGTHNQIVVTNVGKPTKLSHDWITGNVYFVDSGITEPQNVYIRVCNITKKRCTRLLKLPEGSKVTALVIDPNSYQMFYCLAHAQESVIWSASLSGKRITDVTAVHNCTGLAIDSFKKVLYVAESSPDRIMEMDFDGGNQKKLIIKDPHLLKPHDLAIFEGYAYFVVGNSFKLNRCLLYGKLDCQIYLQRMFEANTFAIRHENLQKMNVENTCKEEPCENVCVLEDDGPLCLCENGDIAVGGKCGMQSLLFEPQFSEWELEDWSVSYRLTFSVVISVTVLFALYLLIFGYYHFVYRKRPQGGAGFGPVRFQNVREGTSDPGTDQAVVEIPDTSESEAERHEYVNPMERLREAWHRRRQIREPVGSSGMLIPMPDDESSDAEPDHDVSDTARIIHT